MNNVRDYFLNERFVIVIVKVKKFKYGPLDEPDLVCKMCKLALDIAEPWMIDLFNREMSRGEFPDALAQVCFVCCKKKDSKLTQTMLGAYLFHLVWVKHFQSDSQ